MTTIVAILISVKDHLFIPLRQIESKLGWRVRGNMEIQNLLNHSVLISNLAPMETILIFFKRHNLPNHTCMSGYTETCLKAWGSHGNRDFLNAVNSGIDHRNIQCSALTLTKDMRRFIIKVTNHLLYVCFKIMIRTIDLPRPLTNDLWIESFLFKRKG